MSIPGSSESEQIERLKRELEWAHMKIRVLEERLRLQRIEKYGPKSEKLSDAQLELLEPNRVSARLKWKRRASERLCRTLQYLNQKVSLARCAVIRGGSSCQRIFRVSSRWSAAPPMNAFASNAAMRKLSSATNKANISMWSRRAIS